MRCPTLSLPCPKQFVPRGRNEYGGGCVSGVVGDFRTVAVAFDRPTMRLLDSKWAPLRVAIFKSVFSRERRSVQAEQLHVQVEVFLSEFATAGVDIPPNATGRSLCQQFMKEQWLYRANGAEGEEYSLTSHALEALDLIDSMTRTRALISESRLNTILDTVRRVALEASPDATARVARLNAQILELVAERDRLTSGADTTASSDDRMLEMYLDLHDLIRQLPSDFIRVRESMQAMHRKILKDFRDDDRSIGQVIDEYLARSDDLIRSTAEGRAFDGAFVLLRDEGLLSALRDDLKVVLNHSFAQALTPAEQREFLATVGIIRQGTEDILSQRRKVSSTLRDHIVNHDVTRERELDQVLRAINKELHIWMGYARPRALVPIELMPGALNIGHARERFHDPASAEPPPPLDDVAEHAPEALSLEDIRKQGGPSLEELRQSLVAAFASGNTASIGAMFNALPAELRRPVEILGLLHLATQADAIDQRRELEPFDAIRPDGTRRTFFTPSLTLTLSQALSIATQPEDTQ
ncbi:hypothetical protein GALL_323460 [mine drainage metagenome]|uniref:DUF3375 domain-containing protein n=1 Tax=mine drainage metagenome TaxID=410659 RepID=A0A1J5RCD3_9ZZZZ